MTSLLFAIGANLSPTLALIADLVSDTSGRAFDFVSLLSWSDFKIAPYHRDQPPARPEGAASKLASQPSNLKVDCIVRW